MRRRAAKRAWWKSGFSRATSPSVFRPSHFFARSPSESKSAAADVVEGVKEFLRADTGGAKFASGDVCKHGCVRERRAGGCRECEGAENGIACAGHVEHLAARGAALNAGLADARVGDFKAGRRDVNTPRQSFIEHVHPLVTAGDDNGAAAEVREKSVAGFFDRFFVSERARDIEAGFFGVANDRACAAIRIEARSFRLHENGNFQLMRGAEDAVREVVGDETLVVVGENERVKMSERGEEQTQKFLLSFRAGWFAAFVIHANNLLVAGNDARFYGGDALRIADHPFARDVRSSQTSVQSSTGFVISGDTKRFHSGAERDDVRGDVAGAAETFALLDEIHDGNRGLRRKARGRPPEVAIEHQVSEDTDALAAQAGDPSFQAGNGIGNVGGHAVSLIFPLFDSPIPQRSWLLPAS